MKKLLTAFSLLLALLASTAGAQADNRNLIRQTTSSDCGPAALATLLNFYLEIPTTEKEMERLSSATLAMGTTLLGLEQAAKAKGCDANSFRMSYATLQEQLRTYAAPVIVNLVNQEPHFTVVLEAGDEYVFLADPAFGNVVLRKSDFLRFWTSPLESIQPNSTAGPTAQAASTPVAEGFVFLAIGPDAQAGRALRRKMVARLKRQIANLQQSRSPIATFRR
jgi:predicted double-glycine peptidase